MKNFMNKIKAKANSLAIRAKSTLDNAKAEGYIDTGVKIIRGCKLYCVNARNMVK